MPNLHPLALTAPEIDRRVDQRSKRSVVGDGDAEGGERHDVSPRHHEAMLHIASSGRVTSGPVSRLALVQYVTFAAQASSADHTQCHPIPKLFPDKPERKASALSRPCCRVTIAAPPTTHSLFICLH